MALNKRIITSIVGAALVSTAMFTASFEGVSNRVYTDPVGHKAVCVGHDSYAPDGSPLKAGTVYTDDICSYLLGQDTKAADQAVTRLVTVPLSAGERMAYTDFVFNLGENAFATSTALVKINKGDRTGACKELLRWDKGKVRGKLVTLPGLKTRRQAEYAACMKK
jgi:lysozyme